jgi:hypothetical protein
MLALAAALAGCTSGASPRQTEMQKPAAVLLSPMNFNQRLPEAIEFGVPVVGEIVAATLGESGVAAVEAPLAEFHDTWLAAAEGVGTLYDDEGQLDPARYDTVARGVVLAYRQRGHRFDVLLIPYVTVRPGTVMGHSVKWDGVTRMLPFEFKNRDALHMDNRRGLKTPCTSLRVFAYDAAGTRLFERYGGLEVAVKWIERDYKFRHEHRDDLFEDTKSLREGVEIALAPLLSD